MTTVQTTTSPAYAELHCLSAFTFRRGASQPEELVARAAQLDYHALAITDECSVAGAVRAWQAARSHGLHLIVGTELRPADGPRVVLLAPTRQAYGQLCALISLARGRAAKGGYHLTREDLDSGAPDCLGLLIPDAPHQEGTETEAQTRWFARRFAGRGYLAVELLGGPDDAARCRMLEARAAAAGLPAVAATGAEMHTRGRRALHDTLTAIRHGRPVAEVTAHLASNGEHHLRRRPALAERYPHHLLAQSTAIADRCTFSLDELRYEYPEEVVPEGTTPTAHLRQLVETGARRRYPDGVPAAVQAGYERELAIIAELGYEHYFLTVHDLVAFARGRGILCQGRGSAANSVVCFCLGITEVDPAHQSVLFERFVSRERGEPPDIDVDFEHHRREEVIQYIYQRYGRHRAALAATVIAYRPRSAVRDVAKALGLERESVERLAKGLQPWDHSAANDEQLRQAGLNPDGPIARRLRILAGELLGFPRHLSQHVGGFVIARCPITELVPVEPAAMDGRTVIQWDKDDLEALGLLKVDVLALGMLSVIRRAFELIHHWRGHAWTLATLPPADPATYAMIQRADTLGVFQIESRAQMAMLPRMRPRCFYDLVIEISIVRPGPIQGDMVHPYLRRREGSEPVDYPSEEVRGVLERTLGVPIFQEQAMELAVVAAGFTPDEADRLRRSMAAWRKKGGLAPLRERLIEGMRERGYSSAYAERLYRQIEGFGEYGFPESHAASFALLVYASAWLKCHEPAAFAAALLNSQPMGFYAPAQIIRDTREHDVAVRPVDVRFSEPACTLEPPQPPDSPSGAGSQPALRLGLNQIRGLSTAGAERIAAARSRAPFTGVNDLKRRAHLSRADIHALARADALRGIAGHRRAASWAALGADEGTALIPPPPAEAGRPSLAPARESQAVLADYASTGFTLRRHPLAFLRRQLRARRYRSAAELATAEDGRSIRAAGLVINRQRPGSAGGITFVTLEDETGRINLVVRRATAEAQSRPLLEARLLGVAGTWQYRHGVGHLIAGRLEDLSGLIGELDVRSRDFG
ncbi:error-prone DNA polymerase [Halorhodospira halophila]|uniref:Error-prone DNA polymerase n=1 Tax=Halorhodospira halophila (strain DSM 244 / SL1) TaxID=349124 RepID=A1WU89_HALHL|nr:error-prone DNA polymerase [Halorhodospira halophila]ABM61251.1 DNA polymerase III, alpha subunit [Halorhodospira halophila SL1]MBK1730017.1 error-prone DNA polymerase [Halorhodospira halophila]